LLGLHRSLLPAESKQGAQVLRPGCWWAPSSALPAGALLPSSAWELCARPWAAHGQDLLPGKGKCEGQPGLAEVGVKQGNVLLWLQFMPFL